MAALRLLRVLALGACCATALAQPAAVQDDHTSAATLPASNEALLLVGQARQAIGQADYRLAIALIERLMQHPTDLVVVPPGRTYYPVWRQAARLLDQLPPEGLQLYRQLYDAEAAARLREVSPRGDLGALRKLFQTYRASSTWPAIGREYVAQALDAGRFAEAIYTIRLLAQANADIGFERRAQLVVALSRVGEWQAAERALAQLAADPLVAQRPDSVQRIESLRAYVKTSLAAVAGSAGEEPFEPAWPAAAAWSEPLQPAGPAGCFDDDDAVADAVDRLHRLPLQQGVLDGDTLVLRLRGTVWAYDALALTSLWRVRELGPTSSPDADILFRMEAAAARTGESEEVPAVSADATVLLSQALRHAISTGFGLVYTVESLPLLDTEAAAPAVARIAELSGAPAANELVARELATGRLAWRQGADPDDPLYRVAFQDCPVVSGEHLCVAFQRGDDLRLALLEPSTGHLLREISVIGPPVYFSPGGGRCLLATDEANIYVSTGNGVVAAFGREDLAWQWATTYASTLAERRATDWWPPRQRLREFGLDRPIVVGDLLVAAPVDSPALFALDRFTGRQRWRIGRDAAQFLVGVVDDGLVVGGDTLRCLDSNDGTSLRWRSVPLDITGRPTLRRNHLFVPTRPGIVELDARSGKLIAEPAADVVARIDPAAAPRPPATQADAIGETGVSARFAPTANLVSSPDALFAVSPNGVIKYADIAATRRKADALLAHDPDSGRVQLALAWADRLEGHNDRALASLEALTPTAPALAAARAHLLTDVLVALARESADNAERLRWLRRAAVLSAPTEANLCVAVMIGRALEDSGAWDEAVTHYAELMRTNAAALLRFPDESEREAAGWLLAGARLRDGLTHLDDARRATLLDGWIRGAAPEFLERLRLVVGQGEWRDRIDRALLLSSLPPELLGNYLSAAINPTLPADEQRRLCLARWDTHVALGLLEEARADQRYWHDQFQVTSQPATEAGAAESEEPLRVRRVEAAMGELEEAGGVPWGNDPAPRRQWKIQRAEFVLDTHRPADAPRDWIPIRNLEDRVLALHSAVLGRECHRTADALQTGPAGQAALHDAAEAVLFPGNHGEGQETREVWPAATWGYLAAIPVRGGLIGVGLGPQRGGGRRLWEHVLPEWTDIPPRFTETDVAGPLGVYVLRRNDRVALVGWSDGQTWWQRDLPGLRPRQLFLAGDRLVVVGQDEGVVSLNATFGDRLKVLPSTWGTPRAVAVLADTLVVWSEDTVAGFGVDTFERRWMRPCHGVGGWAAVPETTWLAYRERSAPDWNLLDVRTGRIVFEHGLGDVGQVTAAALNGAQLLVAGFSRKAAPHDMTLTLHLWAFDAADGRVRWDREIETSAPVNLTQLTAHAGEIPLLIAGNRDEFSEGVNYRSLALQLVDKRTGEPGEPLPIQDDFHDGTGVCGAYLLATPSRIIVQANGDVAAYGTSAVTRNP